MPRTLPTALVSPDAAMARRRLVLASATGVGLGLGFAVVGGCALRPDAARAPAAGREPPWQRRLAGTTIALLGEVHDNAEGHRHRLDLLRAAVDRGWRPAIVMEQFDTDRQPDIERSRSERPQDAAHLIAAASGARSGWDWAFYEPVVALALAHGLPLHAGNLSRGEAARIVREGPGPVLGDARLRGLGLAAIAPADLASGQEAEIEAGHCGALPKRALPGMVQAQFARDAVMADALRRAGAGGAVLLAGNGHVRRDLGVPRWLGAADAPRLLVVGFLEGAEEAPPTGRYDAIVRVAATAREDPCLAFEKR